MVFYSGQEGACLFSAGGLCVSGAVSVRGLRLRWLFLFLGESTKVGRCFSMFLECVDSGGFGNPLE